MRNRIVNFIEITFKNLKGDNDISLADKYEAIKDSESMKAYQSGFDQYRKSNEPTLLDLLKEFEIAR